MTDLKTHKSGETSDGRATIACTGLAQRADRRTARYRTGHRQLACSKMPAPMVCQVGLRSTSSALKPCRCKAVARVSPAIPPPTIKMRSRSATSHSSLRRVVAALSLCVGIEAFIVLEDVCGLEAKEAVEVSRWAAQALLQSGLREAATSSLHSL